MFDISGAFENWDETQMAVLRKIQQSVGFPIKLEN
jgi:hypothetical protein